MRYEWHKLLRYFKHHAADMLSGSAVVGIFATAIFSSVGTLKAYDALAELEYADPKEKRKKVIPYYIPGLVCGALTAGCVLGANNLHNHQKLELAGLYALYAAKLAKYKSHMDQEQIDGIEDDICRSKIAGKEQPLAEHGATLFYESFSGRYFWSTIEAVQAAEYELNRLFILRGYVNLNDFYRMLDISETAIGESVGWTIDLGIDYGYEWIDFRHRKLEENGEVCYILEYIFEPFPEEVTFMSSQELQAL